MKFQKTIQLNGNSFNCRASSFILLCHTFLFAVSIILITPKPANGETLDAKEVLPEIIHTIRNMQNTQVGKGSASVTRIKAAPNRESQIAKYDIDFMFKGGLSKSHIKGRNDGQANKDTTKNMIWFVNSKINAMYDHISVLLRTEPFAAYQQAVGRDFNPKTFSVISEMPLPDYIEKCLSKANRVTCSIDGGKLTMTFEFEEGSMTSSKHVLILDTAMDYLPTSWVCEVIDPDVRVYWRKESKWRKVNGDFYITHALYESGSEAFNSSEETVNETTKVTIDQFTNDVVIDDIEFTLAGLNLPPATPVTDLNARIYYVYGQKESTKEPFKDESLAPDSAGQCCEADSPVHKPKSDAVSGDKPETSQVNNMTSSVNPMDKERSMAMPIIIIACMLACGLALWFIRAKSTKSS